MLNLLKCSTLKSFTELGLKPNLIISAASPRFKSGKQCTSGKEEKPKKKEQCSSGEKPKKKEQCSSGEKPKKKEQCSSGEKPKKKEQCCSGEKPKRKEQCDSGEKQKTKEQCDSGDQEDSVPRIAINGFGRIGRTALRIAVEHGCPLEIVAINDANMKTDYMAYLLKYDSTYGRFISDISVEGTQLVVDGKTICTYNESEPKNIPWKDLGVDYVIEATGRMTTAKKAEEHISSGAKKVVVTVPCEGAPTFVVGVNLDDYDSCKNVVSSSSGATNAIAPLAKIIHENFEIVEGIATAIQPVRSSQRTIDGPSSKSWREGRGALQNIITRSTAAAKALGQVLPDLDCKLSATSLRVPLATGALVDLTCRLKKDASLDDIKCALSEAAEGCMMGIIDVTNEKVVSSDFVGSHYSCIYDSKASMAVGKKFVKLLAWYDSEYGYACRVIDLIKFMHAEQKS
uniref:glyceraldehyde-3-phosphate dehydrogenase (NADP(+)) (phosphorylating) n=1 Tax=Graphocephala atropunctata TaxID=36148 RepID=A0A1B6L149_9HEMI